MCWIAYQSDQFNLLRPQDGSQIPTLTSQINPQGKRPP